MDTRKISRIIVDGPRAIFRVGRVTAKRSSRRRWTCARSNREFLWLQRINTNSAERGTHAARARRMSSERAPKQSEPGMMERLEDICQQRVFVFGS
jgi:hypothetical protein